MHPLLHIKFSFDLGVIDGKPMNLSLQLLPMDSF